MTVIYEGLQGDNEPFCDTIRAWLHAGNAPEHVEFVSGGGTDEHTDKLTKNDLKILKKDGAVFVKIYDGDTTILEQVNDLTYGYQAVYIDIYGRHGSTKTPVTRDLMYKVRDYINEHYLEWVGNSAGFPLPKARSETSEKSAIIGFYADGISWDRVPEDEEVGLTEQFSGIIKPLFQLCKTA